MNKIKLASRFLDNGDEIVEVIIPETRIFVTVDAAERENGNRSEKIAFSAGRCLRDQVQNAVMCEEGA